MSLTLFWIGAGIVFLILEIMTATFYGLSLAIAAFSVAVYATIVAPGAFDVVQGLIFVVVALIASYFLPKWLTPKEVTEKPQGLDMYLSERHRVRAVDEDFKVKLDGVQYLVISDDDLEDKDLVELVERKGSVFVVEKV